MRGDILSDQATAQLHRCVDELHSFGRALAKPTDELNFVLHVISDIRANNMRMELLFRDKFECMRLYGIRTFAQKVSWSTNFRPW
jgi:hypothetical protein